MKSVIEEASSLEKAIERGWIKAGKPQEFSVKIFQEPTKNFLGLTKQTAKVGIFFQDPPHQATTDKSSSKQPNSGQQQRSQFQHRGPRPNGFRPRRHHTTPRSDQESTSSTPLENSSEGSNNPPRQHKPRFQRPQRPRPPQQESVAQPTPQVSAEQNQNNLPADTKRESSES